MGTVTKSTRVTVLERDQYRCQRCGAYVAFAAYSLQHRQPRGMGGSRLPYIDQPGNLVTLCGSATSPNGCHLWAESKREDAEEDGYLVRRPTDPTTVPVVTFRGVLLLDNEGGYTLEGAA